VDADEDQLPLGVEESRDRDHSRPVTGGEVRKLSAPFSLLAAPFSDAIYRRSFGPEAGRRGGLGDGLAQKGGVVPAAWAAPASRRTIEDAVVSARSAARTQGRLQTPKTEDVSALPKGPPEPSRPMAAIQLLTTRTATRPHGTRMATTSAAASATTTNRVATMPKSPSVPRLLGERADPFNIHGRAPGRPRRP